MNEPSASGPARSGIGLALSGGGYRAALFHVGTLRRLEELGVLAQVNLLSSVSGGSITAGVLAADLVEHPSSPWDARIDRLTAAVRKLCADTIDRGTILHGVLSPFRRTGDVLVAAYRKRLFGDTRLSALPASGLQFTFCATNLQTGRLVHLTRSGIVDYRVGRLALDIELAQAVAASSAFPPFLSPVIIDCDDAAWSPTTHSLFTTDPAYTQRLYLTDGGAYDNMGLEPIWKRFGTVLVSDAGAPYKPTPDLKTDWKSQLMGALEIATDQARGMRRRWLVDQFLEGRSAGTYWGIATPLERYELADAMDVSPAATARLAGMRTRLNAFNTQEQEDLINWGYAVTDAAIRRWCPSLIVPPSPISAARWPFDNRRLS